MSDKKGVTWDLGRYFPEFDGPQMRAFKDEVDRDIEGLKTSSSELRAFSGSAHPDSRRRLQSVGAFVLLSGLSGGSRCAQ